MVLNCIVAVHPNWSASHVFMDTFVEGYWCRESSMHTVSHVFLSLATVSGKLIFSGFFGCAADVDHHHIECHHSDTFTSGGICKGVNLKEWTKVGNLNVLFLKKLLAVADRFLQAIDIWTFVGIFFVVISLLEGVFVDRGQTVCEQNRRTAQRKIHKLSRIVFPLCYILFVLIYCMYLKLSWDYPVKKLVNCTWERFPFFQFQRVEINPGWQR